MGFLNFRKKNIKNNNKAIVAAKHALPELTFERNSENDETVSSNSPDSYYSSIADSFMMVSSMSDITSTSLMDEILNELPAPNKNQRISSSGSETSPAKNIRYPLNLKSSFQNTKSSSVADDYSKSLLVSGPYTNNRNPHTSAPSSTTTITITNSLKKQLSLDKSNTNVASIISNRRSNEAFSESSSGSEISSSVFTLSSTEELVPLHHISRSDPRFSNPPPAIIDQTSNKKENTVFLKDLLSKSYSTSTANSTSYIRNENMTNGVRNGLSVSNNKAMEDIQRSPGLAIDRMKERHRQEYRRSLHWAPAAVPDTKVAPVRRVSSLVVTNNPISHRGSTIIPHSQQQNFQLQVQQQPFAREIPLTKQQDRIIVVPMINNIPSNLLKNNMMPVKSLSTVVTKSQFNNRLPFPTIASEIQTRLRPIMKPIQEDNTLLSKAYSKHTSDKTVSITQSIKPRSQRRKEFIDNPNKINTVKNLAHSPVCSKSIHNCYTRPKCHAKQVTRVHHISENDTFTISRQKKIFLKVNSGQSEIVNNQNDENCTVSITNTPVNKNHSIQLDNLFEDHMNATPKLKNEYRRMQQIHIKKFYSVPNLHQLLDNEEVPETQRRKSLENENSVTKPVALVSKGHSTRRAEETINVQKSRTLNTSYEKQHRCHKSKNSVHNCHHRHINHHKVRLLNCCKHIRHSEQLCCDGEHYHCDNINRPRFEQQKETSELVTPSEKPITLATSPSASKSPHAPLNVRYDSLRIQGKNLCPQLQLPVCQTCRH